MNDNIGSRIELIISDKGIRKADMAKALNVSSAAITQICNGSRNPSNLIIRMISNEYGVNETWILTGEGEMYSTVSKQQEIARLTASLIKEDNSFRYQLIIGIAQLISEMNDEQEEKLYNMLKKVYENKKDPD